MLLFLKLILFFTFINIIVSETTPCNIRLTSHGAVCVCTAKYCDYLENPKPTDNNFVVISSTKGGLRFSVTNGTFSTNKELKIKDFNDNQSRNNDIQSNFDPLALIIEKDGGALLEMAVGVSNGKFFSTTTTATKEIAKITVDRSRRFQKVKGFGGAFTGSVSYILNQLKSELQDQIYKTFFHKTGIGFNILRMSIGGSDFDLKPWAYNEIPINDVKLTNFTELDQLDLIKVQQIKRLKDIAEIENLKIMAAAWSPPKWMKSNNEWTGFSYLKPEYYQTWADYHLRFLELMASKNMSIWAISTGNEPLNGVIGWFFVRFMSMGWTPSNQAIWLSEHLGPTIKRSKHKDVLIFGNDDQRYTYPAWFRTMKISRNNALDYLDGLAVHWYWDDVFAPNLIDEAHQEMPNKLLFNTESCVGDKPWQTHGPELGSWDRGEQYIKGFLQNFQHAFNGWIDWNIVLNEAGGPNYVKNHVDAPVIVNTTSELIENIGGEEFYKQPIFYAMGHFSKFIPIDSVRIYTEISSLTLDAVGFQRPDGSIAVILFNSGNTPIDVSFTDTVHSNFFINIPPRSIHTIIYN